MSIAIFVLMKSLLYNKGTKGERKNLPKNKKS